VPEGLGKHLSHTCQENSRSGSRRCSGIRRVATTFRARAADELSREIDAAIGAGVVDVVLPEARIPS